MTEDFLEPDYSDSPKDDEPEEVDFMTTDPFFDLGTSNKSPWEINNKPSFGGGGWGSASSSPSNWGNNNSGDKKEIDRTKKVLICDLLDCLIETIQSEGRPGLLPRGIYDIKLRFDVWNKLGCFNPDRIYALFPRRFLAASPSGTDSTIVLINYVMCALADYLRIPFRNCIGLTQNVVGLRKDLMIEPVIKNIPKERILYIGLESGLPGQSDRDKVAAEMCGVDYIDLNDLLQNYG